MEDNPILSLMSAFKAATQSERVSVWVKSDCGGFLFPIYAEGVSDETRKQMIVDLSWSNGGLAYGSAVYGDWYVLNKNDAEVKANSAFERLTGYTINKSISIPIFDSKGLPIGVLQGLNACKLYSYADILEGTKVAYNLAPLITAHSREIISCELVNRANMLTASWDLSQQETGVKELDTFVLSASGIMSTIWNMSKTLELLSQYQDTVEGRQRYFYEVFEKKSQSMLLRITEMENMIAELRKATDPDGRIRVFIHQVSPSIKAAESALHSLQGYFAKEAEGDREYGSERFSGVIKEIVSGLNMFYRMTKQYIFLDNEVKTSRVSLQELELWMSSYASWFDAYVYNGDERMIAFDSVFGADYKSEISEDMSGITLIFDVLKVKECVDTLLTNAAEELMLAYIDKPAIKLEAQIFSGADILEISIRDNGRGVPPEYQKRIFEKYFTKDKPTGTGIGLGVVKQILENMGGEIHQYNKDGAVFVIKIPVGIEK